MCKWSIAKSQTLSIEGVRKIVGINVNLERQKDRLCPHDSTLTLLTMTCNVNVYVVI